MLDFTAGRIGLPGSIFMLFSGKTDNRMEP